jgi:uncharacterized RDD family membrane protein YckC
MGKNPLLEDYSYEIKENFWRRGLALLIDELLVLTLPLFFFTAIFVFIIFQSNPFGIVVGQIAPLLYTYEVFGVTSTPTFLALIPSIFISLGLTMGYFTIFESNGRRTLGKKLWHLEVLRSDGKFLSPGQAFRRNIIKYVAGAIGFYLLGLLGWGLFMSLACLFDLKMAQGKKKDVRQRLTEASMGTMVYLEHDEVPFGDISIPGEKIEEKVEKKRVRKPKMTPSLSKKKKTTLELGAKPDKAKELLKEKKRPLLLGSDEEEKDEIKEEEPSELSLVPELKDKEEIEGAPPEEEDEEKPKKQSFFSKLFGGGFKKAKGEEEPHYEVEPVPGPDDIIHEEGGLPPRKEVAKDEVVLQFMFDFDITEERALGLYDMGYRTKPEFKDAIPQDLMMVEGINPTIAKRIISLAND